MDSPQLNHSLIEPSIINGTNNSIVNTNEFLYDVPVGLIILLSIFYGSISIIAVVGNSLVIWIVGTTKQMQTVTNLFIANLALADVVIGMFAIPFQFQAALLQQWNLPDFMCPFCPFVQYVSVNVSVFTLTAIAVDRHRAIINPLRARPPKYISKLIITIIWIVSIFFSIPIAYALRVRHLSDTALTENGLIHTYSKPFCDNVNLSSYIMQRYRYYLVFVQYVIPFCVISFVYIQMAVRLWGSKTPGNAQDTRDVTLMRNKKRVIKMLIIVVLLFGVCWLPLQAYNIIHVTWDDVNEYRFINIVWFCCDWLAMSNSCYNPFIYGIYNEKFKREFKRRFPLFRFGFDNNHQQTEISEKTVSMYTRASSVQSNCTNSSMSRNKCVSLKYSPPQNNNLYNNNINNNSNNKNNNNNNNINYNNNNNNKNNKNNNTSNIDSILTKHINSNNEWTNNKSSWTRRSMPSPIDLNKKNCTCCTKVYYQNNNNKRSSSTTPSPPLPPPPPTPKATITEIGVNNKKIVYQPLNTSLSSNNKKCCCQNKNNTGNVGGGVGVDNLINSSSNSFKEVDKLCDEFNIIKSFNNNNNNNNNNNVNNLKPLMENENERKFEDVISNDENDIDFDNMKNLHKLKENINNDNNNNKYILLSHTAEDAADVDFNL